MLRALTPSIFLPFLGGPGPPSSESTYVPTPVFSSQRLFLTVLVQDAFWPLQPLLVLWLLRFFANIQPFTTPVSIPALYLFYPVFTSPIEHLSVAAIVSESLIARQLCPVSTPHSTQPILLPRFPSTFSTQTYLYVAKLLGNAGYSHHGRVLSVGGDIFAVSFSLDFFCRL